MTAAYRRWCRLRRFRNTVRELKTLSPPELRALGIHPGDITRLAAQATRL